MAKSKPELTVEQIEAEITSRLDSRQDRLSSLFGEVATLKATSAMDFTADQDTRSHKLPREIDAELRGVIVIKQELKEFCETTKKQVLRQRSEAKQEAIIKARNVAEAWLLSPGGYTSLNPEEMGSPPFGAIDRMPAVRAAIDEGLTAQATIEANDWRIRSLSDDIAADTERLEARKNKRLAI